MPVAHRLWPRKRRPRMIGDLVIQRQITTVKQVRFYVALMLSQISVHMRLQISVDVVFVVCSCVARTCSTRNIILHTHTHTRRNTYRSMQIMAVLCTVLYEWYAFSCCENNVVLPNTWTCSLSLVLTFFFRLSCAFAYIYLSVQLLNWKLPNTDSVWIYSYLKIRHYINKYDSNMYGRDMIWCTHSTRTWSRACFPLRLPHIQATTATTVFWICCNYWPLCAKN